MHCKYFGRCYGWWWLFWVVSLIKSMDPDWGNFLVLDLWAHHYLKNAFLSTDLEMEIEKSLVLYLSMDMQQQHLLKLIGYLLRWLSSSSKGCSIFWLILVATVIDPGIYWGGPLYICIVFSDREPTWCNSKLLMLEVFDAPVLQTKRFCPRLFVNLKISIIFCFSRKKMHSFHSLY